MNLRELQLQFKDFLLNADPAIQQNITSEQDINALERLAVYKDSYYRRLIDLLAVDFPHLKLLMADSFELEIHNYLQQYPSNHYLPHYLAKDLADYLENKHHNLLWQEMAALEYLIIHILDTKNSTALTIEKLSKLSPEQWPLIKFSLAEHVTIKIFSSHAPFVFQGMNVEQNPSETTWLIWRKDFHIKLKQLTSEQALILNLMQQNQDFSQVCDGLCQVMPEQEAASYIMSFLQQCLSDEIFMDDL